MSNSPYSPRSSTLFDAPNHPHRGLTNNATTNAGTPQPGITKTKPSTVDAVVATSNRVVINARQQWIDIYPFGAGAANTEFDLFLYRYLRTIYNPMNDTEGGTWYPVFLAQTRCQLSSLTGATGADISATDRPCDEITIIEGEEDNDGIKVIGGLNEVGGLLQVKNQAGTLLQIDFDLISSTNANVMIGWR